MSKNAAQWEVAFYTAGVRPHRYGMDPMVKPWDDEGAGWMVVVIAKVAIAQIVLRRGSTWHAVRQWVVASCAAGDWPRCSRMDPMVKPWDDEGAGWMVVVIAEEKDRPRDCEPGAFPGNVSLTEWVPDSRLLLRASRLPE